MKTEGLLFSNYQHVGFELDHENGYTGLCSTLRLRFDVGPDSSDAPIVAIVNLSIQDVDEFVEMLTDHRGRMG